MKKFISGLIAAFVLSAGFVAVSAETAQAACKVSRYVQCQPTATKVGGPKVIKRGKKPKTVVKINAQSGVLQPKGMLVITYRGPGVNKTIRVKYKGRSIAVNGPKLRKKGVYKITVKFKASNDFKDSKKAYTVKVRK